MELPLTPPRRPGEVLPLSLGQREVWLDQLAWPGSSHLNIGGCGFIVGRLNVDRYRAALDLLVAETEALRLVPLADGRQYLLDTYRPELEVVDLGHSTNPRQAMRTWWQQKIREPFRADGRPPWRFCLLRGSDDLYGITIQFHHLVMDGWGTTQIARRWSELYDELEDGRLHQNDSSPTYRQYINDSLAYKDSSHFRRDEEFWLSRLPIDSPSLFERRHGAKGHELPEALLNHLTISRPDYTQLANFANAHGCTPFTVILVAVAIYFARTRGRSGITIGIPNLNRYGSRYLATAGMFVGVSPVTIDIDLAAPVDSALANAHRILRDALRHPRYPLSELTRKQHILRGRSEGLFDILLSFERQDYTIRFGTARLIDSRQLFSGMARYPLGITLCEFAAEQDLEMVIEGSANCFNRGEVELLARRLWHLALRLTETPGNALAGEIELLPAEERWALLEGLHQNVASHESIVPFTSLFERQAGLRPDAVALTWNDGQMTYRQLERQSRTLAHMLISHGAGSDKIVALAMERAAETIVSLLAIARAGAAFLPIDPDSPIERTKDILAASQAIALLIQTHNETRLASLHAHVLVVDAIQANSTIMDSPLPATPRPNDLAYVLFTSGSTGKPKGVRIEHAALARRLAWLSASYQVSWSDRSAQATQYTFDPALIEICLPLIHGASVALPPPGRLPADTLVDFVLAQEVTIMAFVPSTLERFLDALDDKAIKALRLRVACCGGEILSADLANRYLRMTGARLYNVYGPTEAVIFATALPCRPSPADSRLSIGRCIDDTRIYVLDDALRLMPFGESGEICIGGRTLARGYLGDDEADRQSFLDDPFLPGGRIYRTGDLGWLDCDGTLHFAGRRDRQVKLRGYRIEPGEIEAALLKYVSINRAAVQVVEEEGRQTLHAWVVADKPTEAESLHAHLRRLLPDYMLPAYIDFVGTMPETPSGKIDYRTLPVQKNWKSAGPARKAAPGLETKLAELWAQVLRIPVPNATDNFFELGGDSLAAIDILAGIEKLLARRVPLHQLTENPTIESLARILTSSPQAIRPMLRLGGKPGSPPIYLAASGHGDLLRFQALAAALEQDFDLYMLQPPDDPNVTTLGDLAHLYADQILECSGSTGYLAGFSVGGVTALETARKLQEKGFTTKGMVLIDTLFPNALLRARRLWRLFGWLTKLLHAQELSMNGRRLGALLSDPGLITQVEALRNYEPAPYAGPVLLIKSSGLLYWQRWLFQPWRRYIGNGMVETETPGLHGSLFDPANIESLADIFKRLADTPASARDHAG
jgi:amino acid adenylation domain-containing protein